MEIKFACTLYKYTETYFSYILTPVDYQLFNSFKVMFGLACENGNATRAGAKREWTAVFAGYVRFKGSFLQNKCACSLTPQSVPRSVQDVMRFLRRGGGSVVVE